MKSKLSQSTIESLILASKEAEDYFGFKLYTDDIFSNRLNSYFNYHYDTSNDTLELNLELDEGEAFLIIKNVSTTPIYTLSERLESEVLLSYDNTCSY
jgi:hypothetical protein